MDSTMDDVVPDSEFRRILTACVRAGVEVLDAPNDDIHRQRLLTALVRIGARPLLCEGRTPAEVTEIAARAVLSVVDDLAREPNEPLGEEG